MNKLDKKITYIFIFLGIILFLILFLMNIFYNKYIFNLTIGNTYQVSALQNNNYKYNHYQDIINYIFNNKLRTKFNIKNINISKNSLSFIREEEFTKFKFKIILPKYIDEKKLEKLINEMYIGELKKDLAILKNNSYILDYQELLESYQAHKKQKLEKYYVKFINSEFVKKYPFEKCNNKTENCLKKKTDYYQIIYTQIVNGNNSVLENYLDLEKNYSLKNLISDFVSNRYLFDNPFLDYLLNDNFNFINPNTFNYEFFNEKYKKIKKIKSFKFVAIHKNCSKTIRLQCLAEISENYNNLIKEIKYEISNPFKVKYLKPEEERKFNLLIELIKVLGFTVLIIYILFILTNKFLRRKLK